METRFRVPRSLRQGGECSDSTALGGGVEGGASRVVLHDKAHRLGWHAGIICAAKQSRPAGGSGKPLSLVPIAGP